MTLRVLLQRVPPLEVTEGAGVTVHRSIATPAPRTRIRLVTVVWGKAYVEAMLQLAWRSMLSAGNLAAMADRFDLSYALYIGEKDLAEVTRSRQFALMSQLVRFELDAPQTQS